MKWIRNEPGTIVRWTIVRWTISLLAGELFERHRLSDLLAESYGMEGEQLFEKPEESHMPKGSTLDFDI